MQPNIGSVIALAIFAIRYKVLEYSRVDGKQLSVKPQFDLNHVQYLANECGKWIIVRK